MTQTASRTARGLTATKLRLTNIPGTTRVKLGTGPGMDLEVNGPGDLTKDITWQVRGDTLHVTGPDTGGGGTVMVNTFGPGGSRMTVRGVGGAMVIGAGDMVISGRGGTIIGSGRSGAGGDMVINTGGRGRRVIVDGKVVSGTGTGEPVSDPGDVELTVYVPAGSAVQVADDFDGAYEVEGIGGTLDVKLEGSSNVNAGAMDATRISISGHSEVGITSVQRVLRVDISGSGSVTVRQGNVSELKASISGSGQVAYGGVASDADLDVSGSGRIRVDTVTGTLRRDVSGSGRIDVRQQPDRSADEFWS